MEITYTSIITIIILLIMIFCELSWLNLRDIKDLLNDIKKLLKDKNQ